jgi:uncharacterized protein (TIGR02145 family)
MLEDDRESTKQTYKVKLMGDKRYWMVQNLKFGSGCNKTSFRGGDANQINIVAPGYHGDCRRNDNNAQAGYFYNWLAAMNNVSAYYNSNVNVGCSGTGAAASACQGICPNGWHLPTTQEFSSANTTFSAVYGCQNAACWNASSAWEGVLGGYSSASGSISYPNSRGDYWTSTYSSNSNADRMYFNNSTISISNAAKNLGLSVRCVRNY